MYEDVKQDIRKKKNIGESIKFLIFWNESQLELVSV